MKTFFTLLLVILSSSLVSSQQLDFEWLNTDYRGVVHNDKAIVAYGDHGIITYSLDRGKTWKQTYIEGNLPVKKVLVHNNKFWAITHDNLLSSKNGSHWQSLLEVPSTFVSITLLEDYLYILQQNENKAVITKLNLIDLGWLDFEKVIELEPDFYETMISDNQYLYIKLSDKILKIDSTKKITKININKNDFKINNPNIFGFNIKPSKEGMYLLFEDFTLGYRSSIYKSSNKDSTWNFISGDLYSSAFFEKDTNIYFLCAALKYSNIYFPKYYKIEPGNSFVFINKDDSLKRLLPVENGSLIANLFTEIDEISEDTLFAVGYNKTIISSYDGGKSWEPLSYFWGRGGSLSGFAGLFINDSLFFNGYGNTMYKSRNAGTTWIPQKYSADSKYSNARYFHFNDKGEGIIQYVPLVQGDTLNSAKTKDYGETFQLFKEKYPLNKNGLLQSKPIESKNYLLYFFDNYNSTTTLYRTGLDYNFKDSINLPATPITVNKVNDNQILAFMFRSNGKPYDTVPAFNCEYLLLESNDEGLTWDSLEIEMPFYPIVKKSGKWFVLYTGINNVLPMENKLLIFSSNNTYIYYPAERKFDSTNTVFGTNNDVKGIFKINNIYYTVSKDKLYSTDNIFGSNSIIDSVDINDAFNSENYEVLGVERFKKTIYLSVGVWDETNYKDINYIRIHDPLATPVAEEPPSRIINYLWASPPYPNPGQNVIKSKIFWGNDLANEPLSFEVYDYLGNKIDAKVEFAHESPNSGLMSLNCAGLPKGVYIIMVQFPGKSLSVEAVVE